MKAKVIATGEIVDVWMECDAIWRLTGENEDHCFDESELDFNVDPTPQKQSVTIEGWVARNKYGLCDLHLTIPGPHIKTLPTDSFPDLKWEDEPRKVKLTIEEV